MEKYIPGYSRPDRGIRDVCALWVQNLWRDNICTETYDKIRAWRTSSVPGHKRRWASTVAMYHMAGVCYVQMKATGLVKHLVNKQTTEVLSKYLPRSLQSITSDLTALGEAIGVAFSTSSVGWLWMNAWWYQQALWVCEHFVLLANESDSLIILITVA